MTANDTDTTAAKQTTWYEAWAAHDEDRPLARVADLLDGAADDNGNVSLSVREIAVGAQVDVTQATKAVGTLIHLGWIEVTKAGNKQPRGTRNVYRLVIPQED